MVTLHPKTTHSKQSSKAIVEKANVVMHFLWHLNPSMSQMFNLRVQEVVSAFEQAHKMSPLRHLRL